MLPETEARLLHMIGALLYHHAEFSNIPVSKLIADIAMPTIDLESTAKQIDMIQLILRGERTALEVTTMLKRLLILPAPDDHDDDLDEHKALQPRLSGTKDWRLD